VDECKPLTGGGHPLADAAAGLRGTAQESRAWLPARVYRYTLAVSSSLAWACMPYRCTLSVSSCLAWPECLLIVYRCTLRVYFSVLRACMPAHSVLVHARRVLLPGLGVACHSYPIWGMLLVQCQPCECLEAR